MTSLSNEALTLLLVVLLKKFGRRAVDVPELITELSLSMGASSTSTLTDGLLVQEPSAAIELVDWLLAQDRSPEQPKSQCLTFGRRQTPPVARLPPSLPKTRSQVYLLCKQP